MKNILLFVFFIINYICCFAQNNLPKNMAAISIGRSFHGSGDAWGLIYSTEFTHYVRNKLSWQAHLTGTIHDESRPEFFEYNGQTYDGTVRNAFPGLQIAVYGGYSVFRNNANEFKFLLGALGRYQTSTYASEVTTLYPAATGLPFPVLVVINRDPMRTFSLGADLQIRYNYTFNKKICIGVLAGLQTDTEGDRIIQTSLNAGFRF